MREYINLVEGKERLDEVNKKDKQSIQKDVNTLKAGKSTYKDIEKLFKKWDEQSSFFSAKSNHFMGMAAKKLGLPGLFAPEGRTFYKTTKDENSTRFATSMVPTGGMLKILGTGIKDEDLEKMATLNLLPDHRVEQFKKAKPELMKKADAAAPQTSDELDADSDDNKTTGRQDGPDSAKPKTEPGSKRGIKDGKITFSDGSTFYREESGKGLRLFQKKVGGMIRRMDELVRKMNESIPNSLKATLTESDKAYLMLEALTSSEAKELVDIVGDLELAIQAKDDQGVFISSTNIGLIKDRIAQYKPVIDKAKAQLTTADPDADKKDPDDKDDDTKKDDPKKDEKVASGDLAAFAKSGKGGLANDPEEVEAIKELQQYLTDMGFDPNGVDGKYGPGTKKAVKEFQSYFGAKPDGDAGPETIGQIIKLRSIMFKGGKNFADFRKDMSRMEELIKKGGAIKKSTENSSRDFRSLISIVEQSLTEALSDQEKKELDDLIAQYDSIMNDAEFATAIPKPSYDRYKKIIDDAKKLEYTGSGRGDGEAELAQRKKDAEIPKAKPKDGADELASYVNDGAEGYFRIPDSMRQELGLDTGKPKYVSLTLSKNGKMIFVSHKPDGGSGPTIRIDSAEGQKIADFLKDQGAEFIDPSGELTGKLDGKDGEVDKGAGKFTVVPRKGGQGNNRLFGYDVKDANGNTVAKFGKKDKAAAEAEAARLNGGSNTTSSNEPVKKADDSSTNANKIPAEQRIADFKTVLSDPNIDLDTIIKVAKEMKADTEVWNMATPGLRKQLDQVIATGGK